MVYLRYFILFYVLFEAALGGTVTENSTFKLRTTMLDTQHKVKDQLLDKENEESPTTRRYFINAGILRIPDSLEKRLRQKYSKTPTEGSRNGRRIIFTRYNCLPGFYADGRGRCREL
ncbi:hypothetical protein WA026_019126 [Henosepilachna vigintioctopunctata]|uniref:Uncharacterized protein n=1 Tax=Henosepilachna vigintioctopunctata TaxID=420089 RepID=A0AAW1V167_9CUCU